MNIDMHHNKRRKVVRHIFIGIGLIIGTTTVLTGCGGPPPATPAASQKPVATTPEADANSEHNTGAQGDWCAEHDVAESLCTRCNAALIPAFKATGDWCAEHGLPESQCKPCNFGQHVPTDQAS